MRKRLMQQLVQSVVSAALAGVVAFSVTTARAGGTDKEVVFSPNDYAFVRTLHTAMGKRKWRSAGNLATRLAVWRSVVNSYKPGQDPISERYIVTAYGGVIDLRHFLYTASKVLTATNSKQFWRGLDRPVEARYAKYRYQNPFGRKFPGIDYHIQLALYDTYCVERGREYAMASKYEKPEVLSALIKGQYWACTPEDLPSSALGAEFARQLLHHRDRLAIDIETELCRFLVPFKPAPDKLREKISHAEIVFGIPRGSSEPIAPEKLVWFRAEPVNGTKLLNQTAAELKMGAFCDEVADGKAALAKAGYKLVAVGGGLELRIVPNK